MIHTLDHGDPHLHVYGPDFAYKIGIVDGTIVGSHGSRAHLKPALAWLEENRALALSVWWKFHA